VGAAEAWDAGRVTGRVPATAGVRASDRRTEPRRLTLEAWVNRYCTSEVNCNQRLLCSRFQPDWERGQ